jgi:polygalacturonase
VPVRKYFITILKRAFIQMTEHFVALMKVPPMLLALFVGATFCPAAERQTVDSKPEPDVFDVCNFGATGNGTNLDTQAIQKALDACGRAGGGTVWFRPGTYLSKPLTLRTKTTLQLDAGATLKATDEPKDYLPEDVAWDDVLNGSKKGPFTPFISGKDLTDIIIRGQGTIDGSGAKWWIPAETARSKKSGYTLPRPNLIVLTRVKHLEVAGVTLKNSPKFHLVPDDCQNVLIAGVTILAPEHAANTDAIDPSSCRNVLITNCTIDVGDDNVAIKAGKKIAGREFACEDITVAGCAFLHGHGMSIGSETDGGVRNVVVKNCTFQDTENGLRIKSQRGKGGLVENISYSDITMTKVDPAITFTCYYMTNSAKDAAQSSPPKDAGVPSAGEKLPVYRNIRVCNLKATCQKSAGVIFGLPESCISNVVFENVQISAHTGLAIRNAKGVQFNNSRVLAADGAAFSAENSQVEGLVPAKKGE